MSNLVLVRWVKDKSIYHGVEQRIHKKYILNENPTYKETVTIKWGRQLWTAVYLQQSEATQSKKKSKSVTTGKPCSFYLEKQYSLK